MLALMVALIAQAAGGAGTFDTVAVDGGGEVVIRRGDRAAVLLPAEDGGRSEAAIANGRLTIRRCARRRCPHDYRLRVHVVMPSLAAVQVSNGGLIAVQGDVSASGPLLARVEQGGAIDLRALRASGMSAFVYSGGRIFARVDGPLDASVAQGGQILYWGRTRLRHSIRDGGVIAPGRPEDLDAPVADLNPRMPPPPPVPPLPPVLAPR